LSFVFATFIFLFTRFTGGFFLASGSGAGAGAGAGAGTLDDSDVETLTSTILVDFLGIW
jgi:hypothetical protein